MKKKTPGEQVGYLLMLNRWPDNFQGREAQCPLCFAQVTASFVGNHRAWHERHATKADVAALMGLTSPGGGR